MRSTGLKLLALTCTVGAITALSFAQSANNTNRRNGAYKSSQIGAEIKPPKAPVPDFAPDGMPPVAPPSIAQWLGAPQEPLGEYTITLGETRFDPQIAMPAPPLGWNVSDDDPQGRNMRLVQFTGPVDQVWLDQLAAADVEIVQYIHPYTYIVWAGGGSMDVAANLPAVRWTGEFYPAYRVLPVYRNLGAQQADLRAMIYRGANVDAAIAKLEQLGARVESHTPMDETFEIVRFFMPGTNLADAAKIPGVYSIKPVPTDGGLRGEMTNQMNVGNYDGSNVVFPGYASYLSTVGVNGAGVIIANVDGGVQEGHADLAGQFIACTGPTCSATSSSHGTHTAGIMAATGASGTVANGGFLRGQGMAPGAKMVEQVYSPHFNEAGGMLKIMKDSYNNGASLSGNSWGPAGTPQGYDDDTRQVDVGVRDAVDTTAGNQPLTFVLSFMNGNGGTSSQGTPDEAKNIFNIGSTKGQNSGSGSQILAIDDVSSNSAHGPALDGRTIPHMVAPGCYVDSTITTSTWGLNCGTSMASPHVSGAVALFIEYYRGLPGFSVDPSPALVKAAFLPVAHDLSGHLDADGGTLGHPFDNKQGWGRMNTDAVINPPANSVRYWDNPVTFNNTGEEWSVTVSPLNPSEPIKIMLVWTDAPGHGLGGSTPAWVNNLDLVVDAGSSYKGNIFNASGWSTTGGVADNKNNTEGVFLGPTPPGGATIRVLATNIAGDGVPNVGDTTDQDFAVVCYNCAEEPSFTVAATPDAGTICAPASMQFELNVGSILGFTDPVTLSAHGMPSGVSAVFPTNPVNPPASTSVTFNVTGAAPFGTHAIEVRGTSGATVRSDFVNLSIASASPGNVTLTSPSNGATGVGLAPTYMWNASTQATSYHMDVATDAGFANIIDSGDTTGTSRVSGIALASLTTYYWRVRGENQCGDGAFASGSFTTLEAPSILVVDDDDNSPNVMSYFDATFAAMGLTYDVWNTNNSDNEPDAITLAQYRIVIWFSGHEFGGFAGPGSTGSTNLANWLDSGRCLFLTAQDYHYDRGLTSFMTNYLGVNSVTNDTNQNSATGTNVFAGLGPYSLTYPYTNFSDSMTANGTGAMAFNGNLAGNATSKDTGVYRTVFLTFPFEAISNVNDRVAVMAKFVQWCDELFPDACPADIAAPAGIVDVNDLFLLLANFGTNGTGADLAPPTNTVDTNDLFILLAAFGNCP